MRVTYFVEVLSSWCHWAESTWEGVKRENAGRAEFVWRLAPMRAEDFPTSREQCDWFYRRSSTVQRAPYVLHSGWLEGGSDWSVPNRLAEAARREGFSGEEVRLALAHAGLREGLPVCRMSVGAEIAARVSGIELRRLVQRADATDVRAALAEGAAEFERLGLRQRPGFLVENSIGDKVTVSGIASALPLLNEAIRTLAMDDQAYLSYRAVHGAPPV